MVRGNVGLIVVVMIFFLMLICSSPLYITTAPQVSELVPYKSVYVFVGEQRLYGIDEDNRVVYGLSCQPKVKARVDSYVLSDIEDGESQRVIFSEDGEISFDLSDNDFQNKLLSRIKIGETPFYVCE